MTILFQCRKCGVRAASLEGHRCVAAGPDRLALARAVLSEAEGRVGASVAGEAFREAAIHGQAFVKDGRVLRSGEVLAPAKEARGFDRVAYHKVYMKTYMRGWRARRKKGGAT